MHELFVGLADGYDVTLSGYCIVRQCSVDADVVQVKDGAVLANTLRRPHSFDPVMKGVRAHEISQVPVVVAGQYTSPSIGERLAKLYAQAKLHKEQKFVRQYATKLPSKSE